MRKDCIVKKLLEFGADVDLQDSEGKTAMMLAIEVGQFEYALKLIDSGCDVDIADDKGLRALEYLEKCNAKYVNRHEQDHHYLERILQKQTSL